MEILARKNNITCKEVFLGICQQTGHGKESLTLSDKRLLTETAKSGNAKTALLQKIIKQSNVFQKKECGGNIYRDDC